MFLLCRRAKALWLHGERCCVCGDEPCEPRDGPRWAGAAVCMQATRRRGGDLLPALQHIPRRPPGDTALLHTCSTTQDWCATGTSVAQDFPILPIWGFLKCKECHETPGIEHKAGVFTMTGIMVPAYPTWENTPKYCETTSSTSCLILQSLFKVQPVIRSVSCACCLSPGQRQLIWNWGPCNRNLVSKHPQQLNPTRLTDAIKELKKKNIPA